MAQITPKPTDPKPLKLALTPPLKPAPKPKAGISAPHQPPPKR